MPNGVTIDLDQASFGYQVGELETVVSSEKDISLARETIQKTARILGICKLKWLLITKFLELFSSFNFISGCEKFNMRALTCFNPKCFSRPIDLSLEMVQIHRYWSTCVCVSVLGMGVEARIIRKWQMRYKLELILWDDKTLENYLADTILCNENSIKRQIS